MRLELEDGTIDLEVSAEALRTRLGRLRVPGCSFAVLESGPGCYIQTAKNDDGSYELEYQDGDLSRHYHLPVAVDAVQVLEAFQGYLVQKVAFLQRYPWQKLTLNYGPKN